MASDLAGISSRGFGRHLGDLSNAGSRLRFERSDDFVSIIKSEPGVHSRLRNKMKTDQMSTKHSVRARKCMLKVEKGQTLSGGWSEVEDVKPPQL